jgi:hypothetical protein
VGRTSTPVEVIGKDSMALGEVVVGEDPAVVGEVWRRTRLRRRGGRHDRHSTVREAWRRTRPGRRGDGRGRRSGRRRTR